MSSAAHRPGTGAASQPAAAAAAAPTWDSVEPQAAYCTKPKPETSSRVTPMVPEPLKLPGLRWHCRGDIELAMHSLSLRVKHMGGDDLNRDIALAHRISCDH